MDEKIKRIQDLFDELQKEGVVVDVKSQRDSATSIVSTPTKLLAERLKTLGAGVEPDDYWVQANWSKSF